MDIVEEVYNKYKKSPNKIIAIYKTNKGGFTDRLLEGTKYLNGLCLKREVSQRVYHYIHKLEEIPKNKYGWYLKYLNLVDGYSDEFGEILREKSIDDLNEIELAAYCNTAPLRTKGVVEYIINKTSFLKNSDIFTRRCYLRYGIDHPITKGGKEIKIFASKLNLIETYSIFQKNKYEFLKDWLYGDEEKRRFIMPVVKDCDNIIEYINSLSPNFLEKDYNNIMQKLYCIINNINELPKCAHCGNTISVEQFSTGVMKYPKTCSVICSNKYVENIQNRLKHNNENSNGFFTNVGKNEDKILDCLGVKVRQKQVSKYFVDGICDDVIVEVNEKHHLWTKHTNKDIEKYKEFKRLGYKIIVIWDTLYEKLSRIVEKRKKYEKTMLELGIDIVFIQYNGFDVITDTGLQPFLYSSLMGKKKVFELKTQSFNIETTDDHKFFKEEYEEIQLKKLKVGDLIYTKNGLEKIISILDTKKEKNVYDLISVKGSRFFANGILVHNCLVVDEAAHIEPHILEEFWSAVYPTISNDEDARILMSSTPNGVGNLFHELWEKSQEDNSSWGSLKVYWHEIDGRDESWAKDKRRDLGDEKFEQEYECKFLESGGSNIPEDLYNELAKGCIQPRIELTQFDGYKIYKEPNLEDRIYVAGVDIAEGVGECNSAIQILDVTDMSNIEQVATYANNQVGPNEFARQLNEIMMHWGKPPLAIERNNTGGGLVIKAMDTEYNYPALVNFAFKQGRVDYGHLKGITSSTNTKYYGVMNMFYFLKTHRRVRLRDIKTLEELNTFVRHKNEKWARKSDSYYDDRVDALIWALICVHEAVAQQFFTVNMWDDNKKPFGLEPLYEIYGRGANRYRFGTEDNNWGVDSLVMPSGMGDPFIDEMNDAGWLLPEQDAQRGWRSYEPSPYQYLNK
jgi:very-short-patch-repair endonuclease